MMETPVAEHQSRAATLALIGGELSLDFTNTVGNHNVAQPHEYLETYADLVAWSEHAGILSQLQAHELLADAARRPASARAALERAVALRQALYGIFGAIALEKKPGPGDLEIFNRELAQALPHGCVAPMGTGFQWEWQVSKQAFDRMLWPVARSAADLLMSEELVRVRECSSDECGWLFIDTSRNHSRRWCSMNDCGNRAKAHRHYHRKRAVADTCK